MLHNRVAESLCRHSWWAYQHLSLEAERAFGSRVAHVPLRNGVGIANLETDPAEITQVLHMSAELGYDGCFVDIGANVGQCVLALMASGIDADYFGFEPDVDASAYVRELLRANQLDGAVIVPAALGETEGSAVLHTRGRANVGSTLEPRLTPAARFAGTTRVAMSTGDRQLAHLADDGVLLIKIDVEGFETAVLRGLRDTLRRTRAPLYIEVLAYDHFVDGSYSREYFGSRSNDQIEEIVHARAQNGREVERILESYDYRIVALGDRGGFTPVDSIDLGARRPGAQGERNFLALHRTCALPLVRSWNAQIPGLDARVPALAS